MATREEAIKAIQQVYDPEIPVNIYDLGLIYDIQVNQDKVSVKMTLTSQGCPSAQQIPEMIRTRLGILPGVKDVDVKVVWEPQWNPSMISTEGKKVLKLEDES
ncbi:MAG: hypothetical protein A3C35_07820 [Omnitrophica bacterium RIFCSPHIGHO2_02_FULL_46_11]|nr:MAG: hypothetical protein A3A81_05440 [Omnitrophica bacterium RIFCSPLOWO2_01_FULL_45_10b]OGW86870.1 MAG: hypothetical protein A3C35_07820 [Omnitrophica bacterium RIFCSPHIGHO2_02_FULL_46_11]